MPSASRDLRQESLRTLLVGDFHRPEFAEARADLAGLGPLLVAASAAEAAESIEANQLLPHVIVLAETYPGQIALADVERLRRLAPLARMIGLLGSWCEGETRTGRPWPGVIRVYWYEWGSCRRELERLGREGSSLLSLPSTATDEERLLARGGSSQPSGSGLIVVSSPHRAMVDWLSDVCRQRGYQTHVWAPGSKGLPRNVAAAIVEVDPLRDEPFAPLRTLAQAVRPAQVIALLEFPRTDECRLARRLGARIVLPNPPLLDDLFAELDSAVAAAAAAI